MTKHANKYNLSEDDQARESDALLAFTNFTQKHETVCRRRVRYRCLLNSAELFCIGEKAPWSGWTDFFFNLTWFSEVFLRQNVCEKPEYKMGAGLLFTHQITDPCPNSPPQWCIMVISKISGDFVTFDIDLLNYYPPRFNSLFIYQVYFEI